MLRYTQHLIDENDIRAVCDILRGESLTQGRTTSLFEDELSRFVGSSHTAVCSSGTAALHLLYIALGLGQGDEIITSPVTFSATAMAAKAVGAQVRFADIDPRTGNLDPNSVEAAISWRTRAIVAVHLGGLPCDLTELRTIADRYRLCLLDDSAHALGATYQGRTIGGHLTDASTFSFHPAKHITTGEGGAVTTNDPALHRAVTSARQHGVVRDPQQFVLLPEAPWTYEVQEFGLNYRMCDIAAALGLSQLTKLPTWLSHRRTIAQHYRKRLAAWQSLATPQTTFQDRESAYHLFPVLFDFDKLGITRSEMMRQLAAREIATQVHYIPLTHQPYYQAGKLAKSLPGVDAWYRQTLSLPMHAGMTLHDVDRVVNALEDISFPRSNR